MKFASATAAPAGTATHPIAGPAGQHTDLLSQAAAAIDAYLRQAPEAGPRS